MPVYILFNPFLRKKLTVITTGETHVEGRRAG